MRFKKNLIISIGTLLTTITASAFAVPNLYVINNTNQYSSVLITSGTKPICSPTTTPPGGTTTVGRIAVRVACSFKAICTAELYTSNNCTDKNIANITIDTNTLTISNLILHYPDQYQVTASGTTVSINQIR